MPEDMGVMHNLIMENRKNAVFSGVKDVMGFDNETVMLKTSMGDLTVRGNDLKINSFNSESGDLHMQGLIIALVYTAEKRGGGFFSRAFK